MRFTIIDSLGDFHTYDVPGAQGVFDALSEVGHLLTDKGKWVNPTQIVTITKATVQDG